MAFAFTYGLMKIQGGPEMWKMIGGTMNNVGISFVPEFWGFLASASEFFGGILILLGLFTRTAAFFMAFTMLMASLTHLKALDPWHIAILPMELFSVFMAFIFLGAGKYSMDHLFFSSKRENQNYITE
ncbi:MAG: DoxX family protein [Ignavibacteria bacterium]|nr:DoxX family protein [Ignavibacteria bacterium]